MTGRLKSFRHAAANRMKTIVYLPPVRRVIRRLATSRPTRPLRDLADRSSFNDAIRRISTPILPPGSYYAKLTITEPSKLRGRSFRLLQGNTVVYGTTVDQDVPNNAVEYLNIIVTNNDRNQFSVEPDVPYKLNIGLGAFSTRQQNEHDKIHNVEQNGEVYYALRGDTETPSSLIITFPDFCPNHSRIPYPVELLNQIENPRRSRTLIVAFQDRYLSEGSYLLADCSGRPLLRQVKDIIDGFVSRYDISADRILFFGESKGATSALYYAEHYIDSQLVLVSPQVNLPSFLASPKYYDNLGRNSVLHSMVEPAQLLRSYFRDSRTIHYFYSLSEQESNHSLIEVVTDVPGLTKYRTSSSHGSVVAESRSTVVSLISSFIGRGSNFHGTADEFNVFYAEDTFGLQMRIDDIDISEPNRYSWFATAELGRTSFRLLLSQHEFPFIKYTSENQRLVYALDRSCNFRYLTAYAEDGSLLVSRLPAQVEMNDCGPSPATKVQAVDQRLSLNTGAPVFYTLVRDESVANALYWSSSGANNGDVIDIYLVEDVESFEMSEARQRSDARYIAAVAPIADEGLRDIFIRRLYVASFCKELRVFDSGFYADIHSYGFEPSIPARVDRFP